MRIKRAGLFGLIGLAVLVFISGGIWYFYQQHQLNEIRNLTATQSLIPQSLLIRVPASGLYRISSEQLREIGFNVEKTDEWQLSYRGIEIPFWLSPSDKLADLVFYAPETQSLYAKESYFILSPPSAQPLAKDPNATASLKILALKPLLTKLSSPKDGSVLVPKNMEEDKLYQPLANEDAWFWVRLVSPGEKEIQFELNQAITGDALLRVNLWSGTEAAVNPDHHYQIKLNDQIIADEVWDGKGNHSIETVVPTNILQKGKNKLVFSGILPPQIFAEISYLDSIELYTWQKPELNNHFQLVFGVADATALSELTDLVKRDWLLDITSPLSPNYLTKDVPSELTGHLMLATKSSAIMESVTFEPLQFDEKDTPAAHRQVNYLIIGPADLLAPLQPLIEARRSEGLVVEIQDVQAIYPQYGGAPEPQAIRHYLQDVFALDPQLKYVMLVGDYSYDPKGLVSEDSANRLPTFFVQTIFGGQTSSEYPFAVLSFDNLDFLQTSEKYPIDIAVGRLPAQNRQQVENWVKKIMTYDNQPDVSSPSVIAIADPQEGAFATEAQSFLDLWGDSTQTELYAPPAGSSDAVNVISQYFLSNPTVLAYFGHGSIEMWGKDQLFNREHAAQLSNSAHFPLVIQMTCLTGYYIHPKIESVSEALLWNPNGGAVILIAPSSLTLPDDQGFLTLSLVKHFTADKGDRIGDVWIRTLRDISLNSQGVRDVLATYSLLGDPSLILK